MQIRYNYLWAILGLAIIMTGCTLAPLDQLALTEPASVTDDVATATTTSAQLDTAAISPTLATAPAQISDPLEPITLPISVYILDASNVSGSDTLSSGRTVEQLETIYAEVNAIWAPAAIAMEVQTITRITVPTSYVAAVHDGDFRTFFAGLERNIGIPESSLLNAFYAREIGGPNGITLGGTRVFFVTDTPSVHDERVSSHEIGHILGLHHTLDDTARLMYPGTNGMSLTAEEITVARYVARGLLDRMR